MFDKIIEVGGCCGMEVNVENSKDDVQNIDYLHHNNLKMWNI